MSASTDILELGSEHEQVVFANDAATGLRAIIAIHSTALGPALGGTRFYPYASTDDAVRDVLNLARGMSYKAALAGLDLGGGKAVIIGDPATLKSEALLRAYGRPAAQGGPGDGWGLRAYGVSQGMRAAAESLGGEPTLGGRTVGVAGVGKV